MSGQPDADAVDVYVHDEAMERLLLRYLERRSAQSDELHGALARRDFAALEAIGHKLLGSGAAYGMPGLTQIGARLEENAILKDDAVLATTIRDYDDFVRSVRIRRR